MSFVVVAGLASPGYKPRCGNKFLTLSGMRRRRRCLLKHATDGQSLVDDFYKSPTTVSVNVVLKQHLFCGEEC